MYIRHVIACAVLAGAVLIQPVSAKEPQLGDIDALIGLEDINLINRNDFCYACYEECYLTCNRAWGTCMRIEIHRDECEEAWLKCERKCFREFHRCIR